MVVALLLIILVVVSALGLAILIAQGTIMAQVDDLTALLSTISDQAGTIQNDVDALQQQLTDLQNSTPPEVDLSAAIAQAQAISDKLGAIATDAETPVTGGDEQPTA